MNEFLQRLKQRKLVQWTVAYVAAAFALLQGIDIVAQQFSWPEGVRRGITLALVVGFFVTLVLAWYHGERGAQRVTGTELLILALLLALGGGFLWRFARASREPATTSSVPVARASSPPPAVAIPEKSIAVLPFENLSSDKENAFFTDGVQDEILTDLARVADLKVISRTSVMQYRETAARNLRKIGPWLGLRPLLGRCVGVFTGREPGPDIHRQRFISQHRRGTDQNHQQREKLHGNSSEGHRDLDFDPAPPSRETAVEWRAQYSGQVMWCGLPTCILGGKKQAGSPHYNTIPENLSSSSPDWLFTKEPKAADLLVGPRVNLEIGDPGRFETTYQNTFGAVYWSIRLAE